MMNGFLRSAVSLMFVSGLVFGKTSDSQGSLAAEKASFWRMASLRQQESTRKQRVSDQKIPNTYFVSCDDENQSRHVTGAVSVYGKWRAYVEVSVQAGCLYTTRLWVARAGGDYRLLYLMAPERENTADGMKILGWAAGSRMILLQTQRSAMGSDAGPTEAVIAMDAKTGQIYQPDLSAVLQDRQARCAFRVTGGGFDRDANVVVLVRVKLFSLLDADETETPAKERCTGGEETWSFNYANGEVKRVDNSTLPHVAIANGAEH